MAMRCITDNVVDIRVVCLSACLMVAFGLFHFAVRLPIYAMPATATGCILTQLTPPDFRICICICICMHVPSTLKHSFVKHEWLLAAYQTARSG
ncbi:hypothetical protein GQ42DRAFT_69673 [Ramicandelaber brevisporus]|nr:hypothetical protein GQ42DRAFT_69673 [Ramicandelaber brevisporus]